MGKIATSLPNAAIALDRSSCTPLYRQLYDQLREAILSGLLVPGSRLPSTRELANELGMARNTVLNAFDQLHAESYLERRIGDGTYVSRQLPDDLLRPKGEQPVWQKSNRDCPSLSRWATIVAAMTITPGNYHGMPRPFRAGIPALDAFPYQLWGKLLTRRWKNSAQEILSHTDSAGYLPLRKAIVSYLATTRAVRCLPEQVIVTSGSQHALQLIANILLDSGDIAWIEDPGFLGARVALSAAGARVIPVPVDADGMNATVGATHHPKPRLIYVTPSHQYPLGMTMTLSRRLALLKVASDSGAWIIEDDYDSEFRYVGRPLAALQGLDKEQRVIYVGSLSKVLFNSLRIGYIIAPPDLVRACRRARSLSGLQCPVLEQAVLADFIEEGHFARHVRRMRALYADRQQVLIKASSSELDRLLTIQPSAGGMHLVGWLPKGVDDREASAAAFAGGVDVTPLSAYCIEPQSRAALLLGYTGYSPKSIWQGVRQLAAALSDSNMNGRNENRSRVSVRHPSYPTLANL